MASGFQFYHYDPSLVGAIIFTILFLATTSLHTYQLLATRTWFMTPLVVGGFFEWIGYLARIISATQSPKWTLGPYLVQTLLLLVAPALFAASVYMSLSRIITLADGEERALIKRRWLTKFFVGGDVVSFLLQMGGGGIQATGTASALDTGARLVVGGLFVQLFFFGCFIFVAVHFDVAMRRSPAPPAATSPPQPSYHSTSAPAATPWRKHLLALYVASALIMVRSVFRVVEYLQGFSGYLLSHEVYLYVFDAVLMVCVLGISNLVHPSEVAAFIGGGKMAKKGWKMVRLRSAS